VVGKVERGHHSTGLGRITVLTLTSPVRSTLTADLP
jgi:hypothetical protein